MHQIESLTLVFKLKNSKFNKKILLKIKYILRAYILWYAPNMFFIAKNFLVYYFTCLSQKEFHHHFRRRYSKQRHPGAQLYFL
jgi:hypothetical protein